MTTVQRFKRAFGDRWIERLIQVAKMLNDGYEHRQIARTIGMSEPSFSRMLRRSFKVRYSFNEEVRSEIRMGLNAQISYVTLVKSEFVEESNDDSNPPHLTIVYDKRSDTSSGCDNARREQLESGTPPRTNYDGGQRA